MSTYDPRLECLAATVEESASSARRKRLNITQSAVAAAAHRGPGWGTVLIARSRPLKNPQPRGQLLLANTQQMRPVARRPRRATCASFTSAAAPAREEDSVAIAIADSIATWALFITGAAGVRGWRWKSPTTRTSPTLRQARLGQ